MFPASRRTLAALTLLLLPSITSAQRRPRYEEREFNRPPRGAVGASFTYGRPVGDFLQYVDQGLGFVFGIVRGVLLPATMKLLGKWNWWLPQRLQFLPEFKHEGEVAPARA